MTYLEWRLGFFSSWISQEISAPATLTIAVAKVGFRTVCALLIMMESGSGDSRSQRCGLFWSVPWRLVHLSLHPSLFYPFLRTIFSSLAVLTWNDGLVLTMTRILSQFFFLHLTLFCHSLTLLPGWPWSPIKRDGNVPRMVCCPASTTEDPFLV